jgi:hypothetical protein
LQAYTQQWAREQPFSCPLFWTSLNLHEGQFKLSEIRFVAHSGDIFFAAGSPTDCISGKLSY